MALCFVASWSDYARDYLNMINYFRTEMQRPLVGFGHSMGAVVVLSLANMHQRLLTTIVTIEPVLNKSTYAMPMSGVFPLTFRKDKWLTREEALKAFTTGPLYQNFHPDVVKLFGEYGLIDNPDGTVGLATAKAQELFAYARAAYPGSRDQSLEQFAPTRASHPDIGVEPGTGRERNPQEAFYRPEAQLAFAWLPFLKPSILLIHGDRSHFIGSSSKGRKERVEAVGFATGGSGGVQEGRVKDVTVKGSHFVPMDNPAGVAKEAADWLAQEMWRWAREEEQEKAVWEAIPVDQRAELSDDWKFWAKKIYASRQPQAKRAPTKETKM
jgi:pimeloyl-ACP methyl ester carboxylesterase